MSDEYKIDGSSWKRALWLPRMQVGAQAMLPLMTAGAMVYWAYLGNEFGAKESMGHVVVSMALLSGIAAPIAFRLYPRKPLESTSTLREDGSYRGSGQRVLTDPVQARVTFVKAEMSPLIAHVFLSFLPLLLGLTAGIMYGASLTAIVGICLFSAVLLLSAYPRESVWKKAAEERFGAVFDE